MNLELKKAIEQISKDKGIEKELLIETLEDAVRTSVSRRYGDELDTEVSYNDETGDIEVYQFKIVVANVENVHTQITIDEAQKHDPSVQLDDEVGFRMKIEDLGRIAAQSAKQVIIQRMRDAEQTQIYEEFISRVGEITHGTIQRRDKNGWIVNLGRTEALLGRHDQIPREHYKRGDRIQALIYEVRKDGRGPQVLISRAHRDYLAALFRREVPEVDDGTVQIMGVARDPGSRAKVAVVSKDRDVDPVGSCVGVRGSRIQNIVQELHGEKIDIVIWNPEISTYARNALAPAIITRINVVEEENLLEITVPDEQLTSAIGHKGQNVKLAAKLLGWRIDMFSESRMRENGNQNIDQLASVLGIDADDFIEKGYDSLDKISSASQEEIQEALGISESQYSDMKAALNLLTPVDGQSEETSAKKPRARNKK